MLDEHLTISISNFLIYVHNHPARLDKNTRTNSYYSTYYPM